MPKFEAYCGRSTDSKTLQIYSVFLAILADSTDDGVCISAILRISNCFVLIDFWQEFRVHHLFMITITFKSSFFLRYWTRCWYFFKFGFILDLGRLWFRLHFHLFIYILVSIYYYCCCCCWEQHANKVSLGYEAQNARHNIQFNKGVPVICILAKMYATWWQILIKAAHSLEVRKIFRSGNTRG